MEATILDWEHQGVFFLKSDGTALRDLLWSRHDLSDAQRSENDHFLEAQGIIRERYLARNRELGPGGMVERRREARRSHRGRSTASEQQAQHEPPQ
eukprot:4043672-Lingulodinium_polyedra.AAC.1